MVVNQKHNNENEPFYLDCWVGIENASREESLNRDVLVICLCFNNLSYSTNRPTSRLLQRLELCGGITNRKRGRSLLKVRISQNILWSTYENHEKINFSGYPISRPILVPRFSRRRRQSVNRSTAILVFTYEQFQQACSMSNLELSGRIRCSFIFCAERAVWNNYIEQRKKLES
jgi:hypothetical protein